MDVFTLDFDQVDTLDTMDQAEALRWLAVDYRPEKILQAERRLADGFYDQDHVMDAVVDRLGEALGLRFDV